MYHCSARPILNHNRGYGRLIFATNVAIAPLTFYAPTFGQYPFAISYREWTFPRAGGLPVILVPSRAIVANRPLCGATLIRTLIAAANPPLSESPHPSHRGPVLFRNATRPYSRLSDLASAMGRFLRQMRYP